jgi:hypothetical protein
MQGAGILTLPQNCKFYTGYSTLTAFQLSEENITYPVIIPDIRNDDFFEELQYVETPNLIPIKINEMPLDALKQINGFICFRYDNSCVQIFNNCFASSHRRQRTQVEVPMTTISVSMSEDEDEDVHQPSFTPSFQRLRANTQSLF